MKFGKKGEKKIEEKNEDSDETEGNSTLSRPQICLIDFECDVIDSVRSRGFNAISSSLGTPTKIPNHKQYSKELCLLSNDFPSNIHEYDIIAIDLDGKTPAEFNEVEHFHEHVKSKEAVYILVEYPQTLFDPRSLASSLLKKDLLNITNRKFILVAFASQREEHEYQLVSLENGGYRTISRSTEDNYSFTNHAYFKKNLSGKGMEVITEFEPLKDLLNKNKAFFHYEIIFEHPQAWKDGKWGSDENFMPLMINNNEEIVSYLYQTKDSLIFIFPQMKFKEKLMLPLLEEVFPSILPELFPNATMFSWKNNEDYLLPYHRQLEAEKTRIIGEYRNKLEETDLKISENLKKYSFLHALITETDTKLVEAVKEYFEWLGFEKIRIMDCDGKLKEEDLQVEIENGLLIIEVKGIGGTSKDSDCSQISKIKYRRCKERKNFDVSALYIVNHQRYLEPKNRSNPPFTKEQINDAENDERGLLTTWDLFKMYFYITDEIFNKEDVRKSLLKFGLVDLMPDKIKFLGKVREVYKNDLVFILNISGIEIKVGDKLIVYYGDKFYKVVIENLQLEGQDIETIDNGEIGFLVDEPVKKNAIIFIDKD